MKFLNLIKKIFQRQNELSFLSIGEIIWIKRYKNNEEKSKIPEGHQEGPAVVFQKRKNNVYALFCGSNDKTNKYCSPIIMLDKNKNNLMRDTYIHVDKIIRLDKSQYINKISIIDEENINFIIKMAYIFYRKFGKNSYKDFNYLKFKLTVGDIVELDNKLCYIFAESKEFYNCHVIKEKNKNSIITINNIGYSINFNNVYKVPKDANLKLINTADKNKIGIINTLKNNYINRSKEYRGSLIKYKQEFFYIYGEEKDTLMLYKIYLKNKKNRYEIKIRNGIYYTSFEKIKINKNENYKILRKASYVEMMEIKKIRKKIRR